MTASAATVGREDELAAIAAFVEEVARGRGAALIVEGEAGIGKSHLLQVAGARAREARLDVLEGSGREIEREVPFGSVVEALGPETGKRLAGLIPAGEEVGPELRFKLLEYLLDQLEESVLLRPAILLLDDLHWSDPSTLLLLHRLARSLPVLQLGLAITFRRSPRPSGLDAVLNELSKLGAASLSLEPLGEGEVSALVQQELRVPPGPRLTRLLGGAGGNPLYVLEALAALRPSIDGGDLTSDRTELPASLYETILGRLGTLPAETMSALRAASVLGTRFDLDDLVLAMRLPGPQLLEALDPAVRGGIVQSQESALAFRHDLVRDALYRTIPAAARAALHRDVAQLLIAAGRTPSQVAAHLLLSARSGDAEAVRWLRIAARATAPQAPSAAVELLERAREVAGPGHEERYEIEADLARALLWSGRAPEAEAIARSLLAEGRGGSREGPVRRALLDALFVQARLSASLDDIERLIAGVDLPDLERARILARAAGAFVEGRDLERAEQLVTEALALAERVDDDASRSVALGILCRIASRRNGVVDLPLLEQAARLALSGAGPESALETIPVLAHSLARHGGRFEEGLRLLAEGIRLAEQGGHAWALGWMHATLGAVLYHCGRLEEASAAFAMVPESARDASRLILPLGLAYLAYIEAVRDDLLSAERHLEEAERESRRQSDRNLATDFDVTWSRALVCELTGRDEEALRLLERLRGQTEERSDRDLLAAFVWFGLVEVQIASRLGREELARRASRTVASGVELIRAAFPIEPWTTGFESLSEGIAHRDPAVVLKARETLASTGRPILLATACEEAGRLLLDDGRPDEAVPLLKEANTTWASAGAVRKERQMAALLRELGVRPPRPGSTRPREGWEALSPTEGQVAQLVTEGLTYRQIADLLFVSRRTVETHVAHIFEKLGVSSRAELAALALRLGRSDV